MWEMNRDLFAKYMRENGYTIKKLASEIGVNTSTLSLKINGHREFTIKEVARICDILHINKQVMWEIFFYPKIYVNAEMED